MADTHLDDHSLTRLIEKLAHDELVSDTSVVGTGRKELRALLAEISKGDRSPFSPRMRQVAQRLGVSLHEIAARAGFLLAYLDGPGEDDYYKILGVSSTATPQAIRDAWIHRISIYHPDRHPAKGDWFTRQTARLNEAYQTLKDPSRRKAYDERRREVLERLRRDASLVRPARRPPRISTFYSSQMRRWLPKIITGGSVIAAVLMVATFFQTRPAHRPDAMLLSAANAPEHSEAMPSKRAPFPDERQAAASMRRQPRMERTEHESSSEGPELTLRRDVQKIGAPSQQRAGAVQPPPPLNPEPKGLDRQEIDALLDEYVDAYEKGDLERLMASLSPKVREKGSPDYQALRTLYAGGFAGREQIIYRLKNVQVEIKGDTATVIADYLISAKSASQSQKSATISGRIEWKIQREGDKPKIVAINY
ncbi:MAG: DnaJ domain-containing protein [candidate division NC10 bacterium]|nr:DnaJ domain-containing protein [candidate division NC10 bacterium]